jgi:hypothetical protein
LACTARDRAGDQVFIGGTRIVQAAMLRTEWRGDIGP